MTTSNQTMSLQNCGSICITAQRRTIKHTLLFILTFLICAGAVGFSYVHFQPAILTHPDFDPAAISGQPEVGEEYGYSTLTVKDGYSVRICGAPAVNGQTVSFFLSNPKDNDIWLRAEILDKDNNILGATGVLKQGEYLPDIHLDKSLKAGETPIVVRIVSYEPNTWRSCGNVNLQMVLSMQ